MPRGVSPERRHDARGDRDKARRARPPAAATSRTRSRPGRTSAAPREPASMHASTLRRATPSAAIRSRRAATGQSMGLAAAGCAEETRAYRASCLAGMPHTWLRLGGTGHAQAPGAPAAPAGVAGAKALAGDRRPGGRRLEGGGAPTGRSPPAASDAERTAWPCATPAPGGPVPSWDDTGAEDEAGGCSSGRMRRRVRAISRPYSHASIFLASFREACLGSPSTIC